MDLVVFFSDEDKITYNIDDVVVGVEKLNKIEELLKNSIRRSICSCHFVIWNLLHASLPVLTFSV